MRRHAQGLGMSCFQISNQAQRIVTIHAPHQDARVALATTQRNHSRAQFTGYLHAAFALLRLPS